MLQFNSYHPQIEHQILIFSEKDHKKKQENLFLFKRSNNLRNNLPILIIIFDLLSPMVTLKSIKRLFYQFDMFCSSELLRYQSQTQYKTLTGGLLSLVIICVVGIGFAKMVGDTLQRTAITFSFITQKHSNPPYALLQPSDGTFMMGFAIQSLDFTYQANLTGGPQYFSLRLKVFKFDNGVPTNLSTMDLQQCTQEHWKIVPEFQSYFDKFGANRWLCVPLKASLQLQGSFTSSIHAFAGIEITPCKNSTSKNLCAPQKDIDALFQKHHNFVLNFYYINPVINANQQEFLSYYVEGNDYLLFSSQIGSQAWVYFSDYTVATDNSILPYSSSIKTTGLIVQERIVNQQYSILNSSQAKLVSVYFAKSENSLQYTRQVQKISAVFSYIGGLVGALTAVLFLIKSYTDTSLQVAIGLSLFEVSREEKERKEEERKEEEKKWFNLVEYMRLVSYRLLRLFGWIETSQREEYLQECQQEAIKQMDIQMLLRRIIKLQTCISNFFTAHSLQRIKQEQPITLNSAKKMRQLLLKQEQVSTDGDKKEKIEMHQDIHHQNNSQEPASNVESETSMHKQLEIKSKFKTQQKVEAPCIKQKTGECQKQKNIIFWTTERRVNKNKVRPETALPPVNRKGVLFFPKMTMIN